jgi:hypothetical protein
LSLRALFYFTQNIGGAMTRTWLITLASIAGTVANVYRQRWCF